MVIYGKPPPSIPNYIVGTSSVEALNFLLTSRQDMFQVLKKKLERAQEKMKKIADAHRMDVTFSIGDWVMLNYAHTVKPLYQATTTETG